jgi:hypothetical protein
MRRAGADGPLRPYPEPVEDDRSGRLLVELTASEALLVVAALRQFEPFWPASMSDRGRDELLAETRLMIDHAIRKLGEAAASVG